MHVLGTPPAFVLSQDQTLIFNVCLNVCSFVPRFASRIYLLAKLTSLFCFGFLITRTFLRKHCSVFKVLPAAALKQLFYFPRFTRFCQALFSGTCLPSCPTAFIILLKQRDFVNCFCSIFSCLLRPLAVRLIARRQLLILAIIFLFCKYFLQKIFSSVSFFYGLLNMNQ